MINLYIIKIINLFFIAVIFLSVNILKVNADTYKEILVTGNQRLSVETVLMFSGLDLSKNIENEDLNTAIKKLYKTNYFKNIEIRTINESIKIKIVENPIIQSIVIKGIKNKDIIKQIK